MPDQIKVWKQSLVSVTGGSGCGRTLAAALLAFGICKKGLSVLLIDLNTGFGGGDLSFYFDLPQAPNWNTLAAGENLKDCALPGPFENLHVLQAPPVPAEVSGAQIEAVLEQARESYDLVVFDLPAGARPVYTSVLSRSAQYALDVTDGRKTPAGYGTVVRNDRWNSLKQADVPYLAGLEKLEAPGGWARLDRIGRLHQVTEDLIKTVFG